MAYTYNNQTYEDWIKAPREKYLLKDTGRFSTTQKRKMKQAEKEGRKLNLKEMQRFRHTPLEKTQLARKGFIAVESSNVSAVSRDEKHLYIRFHNGQVYKYYNQADKFDDILGSNSKGEWVWKNLRRKPVRYSRMGVLPLSNDEDRKLLVQGLNEKLLFGKTTKELLKTSIFKRAIKIPLVMDKRGQPIVYKRKTLTQDMFTKLMRKLKRLQRKLNLTKRQQQDLKDLIRLQKKVGV